MERRRRPVVAGLVYAGAFLATDATHRPSEQWAAKAAVAAIDGYRATVSPVLARTKLIVCRYDPTCSAYGREAFARFGFFPGFALTAGRLVRCNPWARGGADPVPPATSAP
jgi:uncharacterized protein